MLKIGGVKEKVLAGKREGLTDLIFPEENKNNIDDLKDYIKEGVNFHLASNYEQVADIIFEDLPVNENSSN